MAAPLAKNPSTPVREAQLPIMYNKAGGGLSIILYQRVVDLKTNKPKVKVVMKMHSFLILRFITSRHNSMSYI